MLTPFPAGEEMKIVLAAWAAAALMAVGSGHLHFVGAAAPPQEVDVTAKRFEFDPATITVRKGEPVELVLRTMDVPHGLKFGDLGVELKASKGKPGEVEFTPEKTGDFTGHCSVFCGRGHGAMTLTLHVVE